MIPRRARRPKMGVREETRFRSESYKAWIRGFPCALADNATASRISQCSGPTEAAHVQADDRVPYEDRGGRGIKPGDNWLYPLCAHHHQAAHNMGHAKFDRLFSFDRVKAALSYWNHPGNRHRINYERRKDKGNGRN